MCFRVCVAMINEKYFFLLTHFGKFFVYLRRFVIKTVITRYYTGYTDSSMVGLNSVNSEFSSLVSTCSITYSGLFSLIQGFTYPSHIWLLLPDSFLRKHYDCFLMNFLISIFPHVWLYYHLGCKRFCYLYLLVSYLV